MVEKTPPRHVAIIMDGNGRWAKKQGKPRVFGHARGVDSVRAVVRAAGEAGVKVLTLYAFSEENWGRPETEVSFIMGLLDTYIRRERDELHANNVRFETIGRIDRLPFKTQTLIEETKAYLAQNTGLILNVALSYSGRNEIADAVKVVAQRLADGVITADQINAEMISSHLQTAHLPDPDLLIRTSGEQRLSNFLLWQMAYTEFYFTDCHWPDFGREEFLRALAMFQGRERRFGGIASVASASLC